MANHLKWTSALIHTFYETGVRHAIISPGSRSTPITIAAAIHPGIDKKVVLDERSAAFIALGIGKQTGTPALLICTSGTALANYFPAVIEARESGVPLIILSGDRPPALRNTGSSQTIDQVKLFGNYTVFFHEAGEPKLESKNLKRLKYAANQAFVDSISSGGASHINLAFDKPLEPTERQLKTEINNLSKAEYSTRSTHETAVRTLELQTSIKGLISGAKKPLIIAGPSNPNQALNKNLLNLSEHLNAPIIAEPGSGLAGGRNTVKRYEQYLRNESIQEELKPDLILRFGDQPFTKSLLTVLELWSKTPVIHVHGRKSWQDHALSVNHTIILNKEDLISFDDIQKSTNNGWLNKWKTIDSEADKYKQKLLAEEDTLTDPHLFSHLGRQIGSTWNVMLSNSFPVRDMAMFGQPAVNLFVNRGAAGIDGIISTALGIHFSSKEATCAVVGDLAFLHDSNALYSMKYTESPFIIIVVNNGGGNIFKMLPIYNQDSANSISTELFNTYFETRQNTDVKSLAKASGLNYHLIDSLSDLEELQLNQYKRSTVVECKTESDASMRIRKKLWQS